MNEYWVETPLPDIGKAMSVYIREVTTIDEDFHYLFGYAFQSLFSDPGESDQTGISKELVIGYIVNNHAPTTERALAGVSSTVYLRQDPFKETIYIMRYNLLYNLA